MPLYRRLPLTTRGDLLTRDASNNTRIAIGSSGKVLHTDGTDPTWQALVAGDIPNLDTSKLTSGQLAVAQGGTAVSVIPKFKVHKNGTNQTGVTSGSFVKVTWSTEVFDTNNNFASDKFTPTVAGKYLLTASLRFESASAASNNVVALLKNGAEVARGGGPTASGEISQMTMVSIEDANGSTDYFEIWAFQSTGSNGTIYGGAGFTFFASTLLP